MNNQEPEKIIEEQPTSQIEQPLPVETPTIAEPTPIPEIPVVESAPTDQPKKGNGSGIFLIILFIVMFAFVMGMPYITDFLNKLKDDSGLSAIQQQAQEEEKRQEEEEQQNQQKPSVETTKNMICTLNTVQDNYTVVQLETFEYNSSNEVINSSIKYNYTFTTVDAEYDSLKQTCDASLEYITHEGYTTSCSYSETEVEISHDFDLEEFTPITEVDFQVTANATYKENADTLKASLISKGYVCE